jgi:hypothetical protein
MLSVLLKLVAKMLKFPLLEISFELVIEEVLVIAKLPSELRLPELVKMPVKVKLKSPTEKISLLLVVVLEVRFSFELDKILPEFVIELLAARVKSPAE